MVYIYIILSCIAQASNVETNESLDSLLFVNLHSLGIFEDPRLDILFDLMSFPSCNP